ncbi:hypothetical protein [Litorimonas haliclonae]|uniref:hypothetical protein n=1 Tax=Litorimonas haliclonae TaxID=2081977 RepID=UPI0039F14521
MTEEEERLARAEANDADWQARQSQDFDPARLEQACLDALALIEANPLIFMQMRAFHREVSHSGNPDAVQKSYSEMWLKSTDKAFAIAEKVKARVDARNSVPVADPSNPEEV